MIEISYYFLKWEEKNQKQSENNFVHSLIKLKKNFGLHLVIKILSNSKYGVLAVCNLKINKKCYIKIKNN